MEEILKQILNEISAMKEGQNKLIQRMDSLEEGQQGLKEDISRLESKVDKIAGAGEEDTVSVIKLMDKKMDTLATKEDITNTNNHLLALNERLFHQEATINYLKAVK